MPAIGAFAERTSVATDTGKDAYYNAKKAAA